MRVTEFKDESTVRQCGDFQHSRFGWLQSDIAINSRNRDTEKQDPLRISAYRRDESGIQPERVSITIVSMILTYVTLIAR